MIEVTNLFPTVLFGIMIVLTLVLLPMLNEEHSLRCDDEQRTDELYLRKQSK